ncbi:hypothetical protein CDAR_432721 [Caerostris darwini]|uniref:Uncharacterized protein n=1 Tax=Caerostris darwini TaxID=1538125 RepID=A0AAV4U524_9ARAC|nr:hypothetical protein CDAR_432721 [Caerostris darwini]
MLCMDNGFSLSSLITIVDILANLFWFGYSFAFPPNVNSMTGIFVSIGFLQYFILLLITLTPAAGCQPSCGDGKGICSVFARLDSKAVQQHKSTYSSEFHTRNCIDIANIYRINKSLLISSIGTLISYGILVGTLRSVQSSNNYN